MHGTSFGTHVKLYLAADTPSGPPVGGWAKVPTVAPIAWPSGTAKVPVTGVLPPHVVDAATRILGAQKLN